MKTLTGRFNGFNHTSRELMLLNQDQPIVIPVTSSSFETDFVNELMFWDKFFRFKINAKNNYPIITVELDDEKNINSYDFKEVPFTATIDTNIRMSECPLYVKNMVAVVVEMPGYFGVLTPEIIAGVSFCSTAFFDKTGNPVSFHQWLKLMDAGPILAEVTIYEYFLKETNKPFSVITDIIIK